MENLAPEPEEPTKPPERVVLLPQNFFSAVFRLGLYFGVDNLPLYPGESLRDVLAGLPSVLFSEKALFPVLLCFVQFKDRRNEANLMHRALDGGGVGGGKRGGESGRWVRRGGGRRVKDHLVVSS